MNTDRVPCLINRVAASYASVDTCKLGKRGGVIQSMTAFLLFFFFLDNTQQTLQAQLPGKE